ncbi:HHIP-like protein 2 [Ptychodera flava]|uniref:HHIP-like protein 2 n=1 Tax=Ptychodera flava TaxID=63121 RepID=UPI00396A8AE1
MARTALRIFLAVVTFTLLVSLAAASLKCADDRDPFKPKSPLKFCTKFSENSCCDSEDDEDIRERYDSIMKEAKSAESCGDYVRDVLCLRCSPVTSRLYQKDQAEAPLPGLCSTECHSFYGRCKSAIPFLTKDKSLLKVIDDEKEFCDELQRTATDYCYPELMDTIDTPKSKPVNPKAEGCLCLREVASGLHNPIAAVAAFDGTNRLFVAEQTGVVSILLADGTRLAEPFLDISDQVHTGTFPGDERGFLSIAFHPKYEGNLKFYVYYCINTPNHRTRLSEIRADINDPNKADRSTERVLLEIDQHANNHNGGQLLFGTDQYLYLFVGDGGGGGDPERNGQNKGTMLGSGMRIDVDQFEGELPYGIPQDNPFIGDPEAFDELWAYGLRNPWRCSVDRGDSETEYGKGRILCADVGQVGWEEVDIIQGGGNFGWNGREGFECYDLDVCNALEGDILPIHAYDRTVGRSITGGYVYRGCEVPSLYGDYVFGDYSPPPAMVGRHIFKLVENQQTETWTREEVCTGDETVCTGDLTGSYLTRILSFGEDESGELYMLATDSASVGNDGGVMYKFVDPAGSGCAAQARGRGKPEAAPSSVDSLRSTLVFYSTIIFLLLIAALGQRC